MLKEVIVVEGKSDIQRVNQALQADCIATEGFTLRKGVIDQIRVAYDLTGYPKSAALRAAVGASLGIGYGNAKQFVYRLNHYGISKDDFRRAAQEALDGLEVKK